MYNKSIFRILCLSGLIILPTYFSYCLAQEDLGEILPDKVASGADVSALQAEANSFNTIKKGVALSLAMCDGIDLCKPNVNRDELEKIISTLDERIGSIGQRYEESGNKDLEGVLLAYSNAKDDYTKYLDKLNKIVPPETSSSDDLFGQSDLFSSFTTSTTGSSPYNVLDDANDELQDDADTPVDSGAAAKPDSGNN